MTINKINDKILDNYRKLTREENEEIRNDMYKIITAYNSNNIIVGSFMSKIIESFEKADSFNLYKLFILFDNEIKMILYTIDNNLKEND